MNPFPIQRQLAWHSISGGRGLSYGRRLFIACKYIFNVGKGLKVDMFDAVESFRKTEIKPGQRKGGLFSVLAYICGDKVK